MANAWDLIVIGTGAVGSAALRAAAERGARVLGLEQYTPANERGSSHGQSRIFRHAYFEHSDYVPLLRHATARFESLEREAGVALLHRCGVLLMGASDSPIVQGSLDAAARWRLPIEALDEAALRRRFPGFSPPPGTRGAFEANAGVVRPEAVVEAALRVACARGAERRELRRVQAVVEDGAGVRIDTDAGPLRAGAAIVAAGAWSVALLPELARLLRVTRQVQAWFQPGPGFDARALPCWLLDRGTQARALYGLAPDPLAAQAWPKLGLHGSEELVDPERGARPVQPGDIEALREACAEVAPALAHAVARASTCLYTMSPDGHFLLGTRRGAGRVHYAAGLSGHGFKLSPALGDVLVDLALQGRSELPVDFLSPARFA